VTLWRPSSSASTWLASTAAAETWAWGSGGGVRAAATQRGTCFSLSLEVVVVKQQDGTTDSSGGRPFVGFRGDSVGLGGSEGLASTLRGRD